MKTKFALVISLGLSLSTIATDFNMDLRMYFTDNEDFCQRELLNDKKVEQPEEKRDCEVISEKENNGFPSPKRAMEEMGLVVGTDIAYPQFFSWKSLPKAHEIEKIVKNSNLAGYLARTYLNMNDKITKVYIKEFVTNNYGQYVNYSNKENGKISTMKISTFIERMNLEKVANDWSSGIEGDRWDNFNMIGAFCPEHNVDHYKTCIIN